MFHDILKSMYTFYYKLRDYDNNQIATFVTLGLINAQDYKDITGQDYVAPSNN